MYSQFHAPELLRISSSFLFGRQSATEDSQGDSRSCLPDSTSMASAALVPTSAVDGVWLSNLLPGDADLLLNVNVNPSLSKRRGGCT